MTDKGPARKGRPTEVGECSEPAEKRARSDMESVSPEGGQDGGAREGQEEQSVSRTEEMLVKAVMAISDRLTNLEKGRDGSGSRTGAPPEGM